MVIIKNTRRISIKQQRSEYFTGVVYNDYEKRFIKNNKDHRYYGPATSIISPKTKYWFLNGVFYGSTYVNNYSHKQFLKDLDKPWLW